MKYGWRERISGAVILVALGAIFLPMLFDDPEPRQQEPGPIMVIEQPVEGGEARQRIIESPQPPASVATNGSQNGGNQGSGNQNGASSGGNGAIPEPDTRSQLGMGEDDSFGSNGTAATNQPTAPAADDPIADIAQSSESEPAPPRAEPEPEPSTPPSSSSQSSTPQRTATSSDGGWVVQVGSFGQPDNASRLAAKLQDQGFTAYSQPRDNNLTTVYVGPFGSSDAGEKARAELKQAANIQGLLIRKPGS